MTAAVSGRGFTTTDNIRADYHVRERWYFRAQVDYPVDVAWREAEPLAWPGPRNALYARLHHETGLVLVAQREELLRVWPVRFFRRRLAGHPPREYRDLEVDVPRRRAGRARLVTPGGLAAGC